MHQTETRTNFVLKYYVHRTQITNKCTLWVRLFIKHIMKFLIHTHIGEYFTDAVDTDVHNVEKKKSSKIKHLIYIIIIL